MSLLGAGTLLGGLFGLAHAVYVYGVVSDCASRSSTALYAAAWTLLLWLLFGSYLLVLWLAGAVLYLFLRGRR